MEEEACNAQPIGIGIAKAHGFAFSQCSTAEGAFLLDAQLKKSRLPSDAFMNSTSKCSRAGQGRAGQGRAGQGRAGQGRAGQGRAGQGRAGQGRAGQGRAGQGSTDSTRLDSPLYCTFIGPIAYTRYKVSYRSRG